MRKSKKKELVNCIDTLQKANGRVLKINSDSRVEFLTQCQEMAIMVGTEIDRIEGEGIATVSFLEQYCEEIYLMSIAADRGELIQAQKRAQTLLHQIKNSIQTDIPDSPMEVVFLPYKASMWDALDSVYRAAVADETCNVTVVPIPYYNINPKGEVLAVEYEGDLFPTDIPITDFRKIDLAKLHPDVIFIHNPYDEWNKVTQVPVEYFSSTLINYTEHLVYIPYFVTKGDTIKDDYCYMPAVRNAWRTFVQSDAVRDCYIKNGADPKRIVAMGSPKFDMVLQMQENPPAIPQEWDTALGGRKIFLLNTHLNPIINEAEKTIDKLQQIFRLFRERDDVALLWRPHPLSIQTAKSMNPQILEQYMQLIEEFKTLPNGAYDDTPDVHRAIALSDAYIGHGSSLLTMYGITGKPMYMLSVSGDANVWMPEREKYLQFTCGVVRGNEIWASAEDHNGLYKIDRETNKAEFVTCFKGEELYGKELYHQVVLQEDKLIFVPWRARNIAIYSIKNKKMIYISPAYESQYPIEYLPKFGTAMQYENYVYMFSARVDTIRMNLMNHELEYLSEFTKDIESYGTTWATFGAGYKCGGNVWLALPNINGIVEFNLESGEYKKHFLKKSTDGIWGITGEGKWLYVLSMKGVIVKINTDTLEENVIWKYKGDVQDTPFRRILYVKNSLYLIPSTENKMIRICVQEGEKTDIKEYVLWETEEGKRKIGEYLLHGDECMIWTLEEPINIYNWKSDSWTKQSFLRDKVEIVRVQERLILSQKGNNIAEYMYDEHEKSIEEYLDLVVKEDEVYTKQRRAAFVSKQKNVNGHAGKLIWDYVFKEN